MDASSIKLNSHTCNAKKELSGFTLQPLRFTLQSVRVSTVCQTSLGPNQQQCGFSNYPQFLILFSPFGFLVLCMCESCLPFVHHRSLCFSQGQREGCYHSQDEVLTGTLDLPETESQTEKRTSPYSYRLPNACCLVQSLAQCGNLLSQMHRVRLGRSSWRTSFQTKQDLSEELVKWEVSMTLFPRFFFFINF